MSAPTAKIRINEAFKVSRNVVVDDATGTQDEIA